MRLILFEDEAWAGLYPLTELRPVWELRCGLGTLRERIERRLGLEASGAFCRDELRKQAARLGLAAPEFSAADELLLVNGRLLRFDPGEVLGLEPGQGLLLDEELVAARLSAEALAGERKPEPAGFNFESCELEAAAASADTVLVSRPWELVHEMPGALSADLPCFDEYREDRRRTSLDSTVIQLNEDDIRIAPGAEIAPQVLIDARPGPVVIEDGVSVMPFAYLQGPLYLGANCRVKAQARIYGGCHLGPECRVAGELAESILQGFVNKQHEGFLGHSYLGEWCNLGADTNNSDLKNNYSPVAVIQRGRRVQTELRFVGLMMGDHSKTGINTMFNTGSVTGIFANVWGGGFPPKELPPFCWGGPQDGLELYELERALKTARTVKARRNRQLGRCEEELIRLLYGRYREEFWKGGE